jgi:hypothetical protein
MNCHSARSIRLLIGLTIFLWCAGRASAQVSLQPNQTQGYGSDKVLTFTYMQNFDCLDEPGSDLDFNGVLAQEDSLEMETPICQTAVEPSIDPTGKPLKKTAHLYVIIPMFSTNNDQNPADAMACINSGRPLHGTQAELCGTALGNELITLFGFVPEAYKTTPAVFTQCPNPTSPPGTCTMHTTSVDLAPALAALNKIPSPATTNIFTPEPNHSHVIDNKFVNTKNPIWWQVRPVLVTNPSDWPDQAGTMGIRSVKELDAAEKAGDAIEVGSNFFLFFSSGKMKGM